MDLNSEFFLEEIPAEKSTGNSCLKQVIHPIIPGLIWDAADFLTFGHLGITLGLIVG